MESSPSPSSTDSSSDDDESEARWGPLDHLPDIRGMAPGALASGPASLGGGGEDASGLAIACLGTEADMLETRVLGKHAVSPMGSMAVVEQVAAGVTQPPPQRTEGAPGPVGDRPASADAEATPLPPPPPLQTRVAVPKRLQPRSG